MLILIATLVVFCAEKFMAAVMIVIVTTVAAPLGTENVHNFCESPEHNQATKNYLACLQSAEALKGITGMQAISDCINGGS